MADFVLSLSGPDLPDGFKGSPSDMMAFIRNNWTTRITLDLPTSPQAPVQVPIGGVVIWPGLSLPDKFRECNGDLLIKADFPDLSAAIGTQYNLTTDGALYFRLPDCRGRSPVGNGTGFARPKDSTKGKLPEYDLSVEPYIGEQFPRNQPPQLGAPSYTGIKAQKYHSLDKTDSKNIGSVVPPSFVCRFIIRAT